MKTIIEQVVIYLEHHMDQLLENWMEKVLISKDAIYKKDILTNGPTMLQLMIHYLHEDTDMQKLQHLAHTLAAHRVEANENIGDFVYNVSIGRSEILHHLHKTVFSIKELDPIIQKINEYFDHLLYYAVTHYTELMKRHLEEKNYFIEQTHKDRLTILGQMASSFVHEFRNPLTSVIGFIQLLKQDYPDLKYLDIISTELDQLKFRISQFLLVSKKEIQEREKEQFLVSHLVQETLDFLYPITVSTDVEIRTDMPSSLKLYGYREEIRQVMINIILNSLDALENQESKSIIIHIAEKDGKAEISIINNGPPIPDHLLPTIFEPFFTTKKIGTGIGLYVCRKIVEKHQGNIYCESTDNYTSFSFSLPLIELE